MSLRSSSAITMRADEIIATYQEGVSRAGSGWAELQTAITSRAAVMGKIDFPPEKLGQPDAVARFYENISDVDSCKLAEIAIALARKIAQAELQNSLFYDDNALPQAMHRALDALYPPPEMKAPQR